MSDFDHNHLRSVIRHIKLVQEATQLLGERLIESGESNFGLNLIANGLKHDQSKFHGIEWKFLTRVNSDDDDAKNLLSMAHLQHVTTNDHHPEHWDDISEMPRICIAEMVCDWYARSHEMGTGLREWIKDEATKKYDMSLQGKTYKQIKYFVDMLLDPAFKPIEKEKPKPETKEKSNG